MKRAMTVNTDYASGGRKCKEISEDSKTLRL